MTASPRWSTAALGSVATFYAGASLPEGEPFNAQPDGYLLARVSDMNQPGNEILLRRAQRWSASPGPKSATCPPGSVVIPKRGGAIGTNKKRITSRPCILDPNLMAIWPHPDRLDIRFLYHWFLAFDLSGIANGSSVPQLNKKDLNPLLLPMPPIEDQQRISAVLDMVDALRTKRRGAIAQLDKLAQSIFFDMFGDVTSNNRGWDDSRTFGDIAEITSGITKGRKATGQFTRVPYLAVLNVQDMRLDLSIVKEIDATDAEIERYLLKRNDLLLTEGGDPDKLGRGTLWRDELPRCIHQNHIFRVRIKEASRIEPLFLNWLVSSERGRRYFLRSAKQTTGIASINATQLRQFPMLIPPVGVQDQFSMRIVRLQEHKSVAQGQLNQLDALFASLQHRAFSGEL